MKIKKRAGSSGEENNQTNYVEIRKLATPIMVWERMTPHESRDENHFKDEGYQAQSGFIKLAPKGVYSGGGFVGGAGG